MDAEYSLKKGKINKKRNEKTKQTLLLYVNNSIKY